MGFTGSQQDMVTGSRQRSCHRKDKELQECQIITFVWAKRTLTTDRKLFPVSRWQVSGVSRTRWMTVWCVTLTTGYIQGVPHTTTELAAAPGTAAKGSKALGQR